MEKDNTNIVNDSSLLSTQISDYTIHQELEQQTNISPNLEEDFTFLPSPVFRPSPSPQYFINPPPDNGIVEYLIPRKFKDIANIKNRTEDLEDEFDSKDVDNPNFEEYDQLI
jgi:hypothetical protein